MVQLLYFKASEMRISGERKEWKDLKAKKGKTESLLVNLADLFVGKNWLRIAHAASYEK